MAIKSGPSLKALRIMSATGVAAPGFVDALLSHEPPYSLDYIAGSLGISKTQLAALLALPEPIDVPRNWTSEAGGPYPYGGDFGGLAQIPYPGPLGGFTYGPPLPSR